MMDPKDMIKTWPAEVNSFIIQLARQRMQTHEIRDIVKQRFPDITWNERRFYNRLTEERKRIRQRDVMDRVQKLLLLSARLCSVVAAHDDWFVNVESDLVRILDHYYHLSRLSPESLSSLVDFSLDQITMDFDQHHQHLMTQASSTVSTANPASTCADLTASSSSPSSSFPSSHYQHQPSPALLHHRSSMSSDTSSTSLIKMELEESPAIPSKKRKSMLLDTATSSSSPPPPPPSSKQQQQLPKGTHTIYIPPFTLYVRPQHSRSISESTSPQQQIQQHHHQPQFLPHHPQQRLPYADTLSSPSAMMDATSPHPQQALTFNNPSLYSLTSPNASSVSSSTSSFQQNQHQHHHQQKHQQSAASSNVSTTFQNAPPSDHTHQSLYMSTEPYNPQPQHHPHHFGNDSSGAGSGGGMPLQQQATHPYSMQSFNPNYNPNTPAGNTTANVDPNEMSFFDHPSLLTDPNSGTPSSATNPESSGSHRNSPMNRQQQQEAYRSMMDISPHQQRDHRPSDTQSHPHDARPAGMPHSSSNPLFMYSSQLPVGSTSGPTVGPSVPIGMDTLAQAGSGNIHGPPPTPTTSFHQHNKGGGPLYGAQHHHHAFPGHYQLSSNQSQELGRLDQPPRKSPTHNDMMTDDPNLS